MHGWVLACIRDGMGVANWIVGSVTYGISLPSGEPIRVFHEIATAAGNQIIQDYWVLKNQSTRLHLGVEKDRMC